MSVAGAEGAYAYWTEHQHRHGQLVFAPYMLHGAQRTATHTFISPGSKTPSEILIVWPMRA